ncbi:MAG: PadR family transcriptional regulator [Candidatus Gastranaerophilales bacterium]|nr:PadR family transcriptional regulator [Candidatus Gastranaerophilales bacterium]MCM1072836.1 PadR family transcriptional regulator [Bacteroides sp.]
MIELLILHELNKKVLTMYGISKEIRLEFSVLTTPSYGTIKPALNRLEKSGFIKTQKTMSNGGRPSTYYSITSQGKEEIKRLILLPPLENPIQFLPSARIKLFCADILDNNEQKELFKILQLKAESILIDTKTMLETRSSDFYPKMIFDNLTCEYKNFISLLEGFANACKN